MDSKVVLKIRNISKKFGLTSALKNVSFNLEKGEIIGLIGENGSGKSTLSSIISGVHTATEGSLELEGKTYKPTNIIDAQKHGISMITQEMGTISGIKVADNIFLGKEEMFVDYVIHDNDAISRSLANIISRN